MSYTIQNEIIESIARVIQDETDTEINMSPFIAVQVDDTSDISNKCQLTVIIRYVNEKGSVCERFLGFFDVSKERDAKAITSVVMRAIDNYGPTEKIICQTYDGASCMSGQHGGVQALVKQHCPNALFIHYYAHKLNLVLAQGTNNVQAAKLFFDDLKKKLEDFDFTLLLGVFQSIFGLTEPLFQVLQIKTDIKKCQDRIKSTDLKAT
jgi:hypothetical protein